MSEINKDKAVEKKNIHKGHREKMKSRFREAGFKGMAPHNILEILLYYGIPQKDTNTMAHELVEKFGNFAGVLEANYHDLMTVKGMTKNAADLISMILPLYNCYVEDLHSRKPGPVKPEDIAEYLRPKFFEGGCRERVFVLCYDNSKHLIACRQLNEGDFKSSSFDIREFGRIVLQTNCASVIIAHNHPHSIPLPSSEDIQLTRYVYDFLSTLKVNLDDHIIVSDTEFNSLAGNKKTMSIFY